MRRFLKWAAAFLAGYVVLAVVMGQFDTPDDMEVSRGRLVSLGVDSAKAAFLADYFNSYLDSLRSMEGSASLSDSIGNADTEADAFQLGSRLGMRGVARLGGAQIKKYIAFRKGMLNSATPEECARVAQGQADAELSMRLIARADTAEVRSAYGIVLKGIAAEVSSDTPRPLYSQERRESAWSAFMEQLPSAERNRFASIAQAMETASDDDVCWVERRMWSILDELPTRHAEVIYAEIAAAMDTTGGG